MRDGTIERAGTTHDNSELANDNVDDGSEDKMDSASAKRNLGRLLNVFDFGARICELQVRVHACTCRVVPYLRLGCIVGLCNRSATDLRHQVRTRLEAGEPKLLLAPFDVSIALRVAVRVLLCLSLLDLEATLARCLSRFQRVWASARRA